LLLAEGVVVEEKGDGRAREHIIIQFLLSFLVSAFVVVAFVQVMKSIVIVFEVEAGRGSGR
jgi:hypothetical protein